MSTWGKNSFVCFCITITAVFTTISIANVKIWLPNTFFLLFILEFLCLVDKNTYFCGVDNKVIIFSQSINSKSSYRSVVIQRLH